LRPLRGIGLPNYLKFNILNNLSSSHLFTDKKRIINSSSTSKVRNPSFQSAELIRSVIFKYEVLNSFINFRLQS
jgi:hypothetical protein